MTSAPAVTRGVITPEDHPSGERRSPLPIQDVMSVSFQVSRGSAGPNISECDARRVGMVRRMTAARLRFCGLPELVDDATLIVSELVTNAIGHSGGKNVTLTMSARDGFLRITVHDEMPGRPTVNTAGGDAERGRGLFLVEHIVNAHGGAWGTYDEGATIWCSLALPGEGR